MGGNERKVVILQDRDLRLLRELAVMRVIDREQAKVVAGFGSTTRANARLHALTEAKFLRRFYWGTVGGARKAIYSLAPRGAEAAGVPHRRPRRGQDQVLAMDSFTAHQLEVNEIYCTLKHRPLPEGVRLIRWLGFFDSICPALTPDGYAEIATGDTVLAFFIELDRGTESREVWRAKVQTYFAYAASGNFARTFGQAQFKTLVVVPSESRLKSLRSVTAGLTDKIFRFTTTDRIREESLWGTVWQKPLGSERYRLM